MKCARCKTEKQLVDKRGKERTPRGWRKFEDSPYCAGCWGKLFQLRSLVLAVSRPLDLSWEELTDQLESAWRQSTQLSNAIITKLAMLEPVRTSEMTKLPPAPNPYLYPWARGEFPELDAQSINALINTVQRTYNRFRLDVFWRRSRSLPQYRYPTPAPFPSQSTKLEWLSESEKVPVVTLRLGGKRIRLQLQSKHQKNFRRSLAQIIDAEGKLCEGAVYRKVSFGSHRRGVATRAPGGGQRMQSQVFVKLAAWLPVASPTTKPKRKHLKIVTGDDFFLSASISGREQWRLHAEHVKRWIITYRERLRRLAEDQKYERRQIRKQRIPIDEYRAKLTGKHRRRMATFLQQTTSELLGYAVRNGCRKIVWTRDAQRFFPSFPWRELENEILTRSAAQGLIFEIVSAESQTTTKSQ